MRDTGKDRESLGDRITRWIYAAGPSGSAPIAPGTFGSFTAAILLFLPGRLPGIPPWSLTFALVSLVVVFFVGVWSAGKAEKIHGKDPGIVVIDEVAGMIVTFIFLPITPLSLVLGFFLFRAMDILKPYPVRHFEKVPGGWGVMLDDVAAGVYSNLLLRLSLYIWGIVF